MENAPTQEDMERAHRELYTGVALGGPLGTEDVVSRFPRGLVCVDKVERKAWIYDYTVDGNFLCRDDNGMPLDDEKRWAAAEGVEYDVVVP